MRVSPCSNTGEILHDELCIDDPFSLYISKAKKSVQRNTFFNKSLWKNTVNQLKIPIESSSFDNVSQAVV
ncbi:hypothetical protein NIES2098_59250 [Calothrix sp. NIES-2098]|nr:hypothetical protein NIES2098_59250 [Calothrix sp. NIES-2098]